MMLTAVLNDALTPGLNTLNDTNAERLIDNVGDNGLVDVGDQLETLVIVDNISNAVWGGTDVDVAVGRPDDYQLTAYSLITVIDKVETDPGVFLFTFAPAIVQVYEDGSFADNTILVDFSSQSADQAIADATDGNLIFTTNVDGTGRFGTDDVWRAIGGDDPDSLTTGNEANFVMASSIGSNPGDVPIAPDATPSGLLGLPSGTGDFHDLVAVGEIEVASSAAANQGWDAQSDTTFSFTVPEAKIEINPDDTNEVGDDHTFTATVMYNDFVDDDGDGDSDDFEPIADVPTTITLMGSNGAVPVPPGPFNGVTDGDGEFSTTFTSATAGQVEGNASASVPLAGGVTLDVETDGIAPNSGPAIKTFVDAFITIDPDGVNAVGDPHTFTTTVWVDDGLSAGSRW